MVLNQDITQFTTENSYSAQLHWPEERYHELFDNAHDLIQSLTPDGCFSYVNQRWLEALGYKATEVSGLHFEEVIHPEQLVVWRHTFQQLKLGQNFTDQPFVLLTKSGQRLRIAGNFRSSFADGRFVACWGCLQDLTEQERKEEEIRRAYQQTQQYAAELVEKIKEERGLFADLKNAQAQLIQRERLAALGQMAATLAHELRNPLTAIRMGVEYFLRDVSETDPGWRGAALMQANVSRLDHLVEDILYVAHTPESILSPGLLQPVLEDEVARWELSLTEKKIRAYVQLAANLSSLLLDPDQMARVFSNLMGNSVDVLSSGGEIHIDLYVEGQNQVVTFADNGPGISAEHLVRIFEPFFTTKSRGTGLGLYLVKQIIEYHGGSITVWSEVGAGTKFTITLPSLTRT